MSKEKKFTAPIKLHLTPEMLAELTKQAESFGVDRASYIRRLLGDCLTSRICKTTNNQQS